MKRLFILYCFTILITTVTTAQIHTNLDISLYMVGQSYNFNIIGPESDAFTDSLFSKSSKAKRKGYV
jgi:hypothetical protein